MSRGLSVIIGVFRFSGYNPDNLRVDSFRRCLDNILKQEGQYEIIIAEMLFSGQRRMIDYLDVSVLSRVKYIEFERDESYRYVFHKEVLWNQAMKEAKYDVILFLDGDVGSDDRTWFKRIEEYHFANPSFICQPWEYSIDTGDVRCNMKSYISVCLGKMDVKGTISPGICYSMHRRIWEEMGGFNCWGVSGAGDTIFFQERSYSDNRFYYLGDLSWCSEVFRYKRHCDFSYFAENVIHFHHGRPRDYYNHLCLIKQYLAATGSRIKDAFGQDSLGFIYFKDRKLRDKLIANFDWQAVGFEEYQQKIDFSLILDDAESMSKFQAFNLKLDGPLLRHNSEGIHLELEKGKKYLLKLPLRGFYGLANLTDPNVRVEVRSTGKCNFSIMDRVGRESQSIELTSGIKDISLSGLEGDTHKLSREHVQFACFSGSEKAIISDVRISNRSSIVSLVVPLINPTQEDLANLTEQIATLANASVGFEYCLIEFGPVSIAERYRRHFERGRFNYRFIKQEVEHLGLNNYGNLINIATNSASNDRIIVLDSDVMIASKFWLSKVLWHIGKAEYRLLQPYSEIIYNGNRTLGTIKGLAKGATERGHAWAFNRKSFTIEPSYIGDDFLYTLEGYRDFEGKVLDQIGGYNLYRASRRGSPSVKCFDGEIIVREPIRMVSERHSIFREMQEKGISISEEIEFVDGLFRWRGRGEWRAILSRGGQ